MTREIGDIFDNNGMKLKVVELESCKGCYYKNGTSCINDNIKSGDCSDHFRTDNKSVIFKKVKKC